jgi:hypothetical protein
MKMRSRLKSLLAGCALLAGFGSIGAQTPHKTVLVELFTSEGCSSCPPADELLAKLNGTHVETGELVIGLSEHVTYWNSLGWHDPFSREQWTERQNGYGNRFGLESVYTPQAVVNGQLQLVGSDGRGLLRAVREAGSGSLGLHVDGTKVQDGKVQIAYSVSGPVPAGAEVWAAIADDRAVSQVLRGENGGRKLVHVAVARSLTQVGKAGDGVATASLDSPEVLQGQQKTGRHVVLFVQEHGYGKILAVESQEL